MSLIDSIRSMFKGNSTSKSIDIDTRFERTRTSVMGTMSNFYVARDHANNRTVGVKILDIEKVELFEGRFKAYNKPSEGQIGLEMKHPNIVETYEAGVTLKGEPVIIMEYIDGPSLQQLIVNKSETQLAGKRLSLIRQMAESLRYVHNKEYIHRDICPRNYICETDLNKIKLIDFGLTLPATRVFMLPRSRTGTPLYMSPEVVRRRPTDKRVDIFSFGITCYCMCTFEHPWQGEVVTGKAALQHDTTPPKDIMGRRPDMDPRLGRAIMQALEPNIDLRTPTMEQFLNTIATLRIDF